MAVSIRVMEMPSDEYSGAKLPVYLAA